MSFRRRIAARVAAVAVALLMGAGVVSLGSDDTSSSSSDEAGATWSFRVQNDDDLKDDGPGWRVQSRGATWS